MSQLKDDWSILKNGRRSDFFTIAAITVTFLVIIALNVYFIFRITAKQTEDLGRMELDHLRSELEDSLADAERTTFRIAVNAERMLAKGASQQEIRAFFEEKQREQEILSQGECFNVYIANREWAIIPTFNIPADYYAPDRLWYKGAAENPGKIYITEPYLDAAGHGLCFTVSMMLSDKNTVVALDFNFSSVQKTINKMNTGNDRNALIVTKNGMIIGYSDMNLIGKKLEKSLSAYKKIFQTVLNLGTGESFEEKLNGKNNTVFSSVTENGWWMILSVDTTSLYKDDYYRIMINTSVNLWMILIIVFYYLNGMKNRLQAEKALQAKEEFLSGLSKELRAPLQRILRLSNTGLSGNEDNSTANYSRIRESAMQLSEMLDNLFSFSTLVDAGDREKDFDKRAEKSLHLSKVSRTARRRIIAVLTVALIIRVGISIDTNLGWGDTKMTREVELYEHRLNNWLVEQQTILSMFSDVIGENPSLMNDYDSAVNFLNDIAIKYPDISACYLANPYKEHILIMNNGWKPPPDFDLKTRPWYIDAQKSDKGFNISSPYYDARTGNYCLTFSQMVYGKTGEFVGIFAIDFYIERLIKILDASYSINGYAFLVDRDGAILNHPHFSYQMANDKLSNIHDTEYNTVYKTGNDFIMRDFRNTLMTCVAKKNTLGNFTVVVANNWMYIYGQILIYAALFLVIYAICIWLVVTLVNNLLKWQTEVQRRLKEAAKTAVNAGQAKSQFLAQMSHEIRTPINAVLGMNEMILRESTEKGIRDYAENIASASRTLLNLINSILDFSKIEEGKMEIIPVRYETLNMVDDLVNMIYERAHKKNLSFVTKIDPQLPKALFGDDMRIKQVITNLLTNAVKYTNTGTVTLTMRGEIIGDDSDALKLFVSVEDTGIGIREEDIDKLFQSFIRLDETKNKNIEGTGLGISIVKELLRMMNSKLEVSSVYGEGSMFSFTLQQKILDKTPVGNYGEHHGKKNSEATETKKFVKAPGARILAVDDTNINLKVINGLLKRNLIVPDLVDSGEKCLQYAGKYSYHIIFLDHMMPRMDGIETLKRLKKMNLPATTKIIVLTANAISGARENYIANGFDDYLSKPINTDELENILERYLPPELILGDDFDTDTDEDDSDTEILDSVPAAQVVEPEDDDSEDSDEFSSKQRLQFEKICPSINLDTALSNCMGSKEFFSEVAAEFVRDDKTSDLTAALSENDFDSYRITVHALKSTSLVVGAVTLNAAAKAQEASAKAENAEELTMNHAPLMELYAKVRNELNAWLEKNS